MTTNTHKPASGDVERWAYVCNAFNGMGESASEIFLECLGIEGSVFDTLDVLVDAAMRHRDELEKGHE